MKRIIAFELFIKCFYCVVFYYFIIFIIPIELPKNTTVVLFGKKNEILSELKQHDFSADKFEIVDCSEVISMGEHATKAYRSKTDSSISKGFEYLAKGV